MSSFLLKIVAIITMTIDHIGAILFNNNSILRIIGRIAMPIFAFQIAIGFKNTHSKEKYIFRMFFTALLSEISFMLMLTSGSFAYSSHNICFTFTLALIILYLIELGKKYKIFIMASIFLLILSAFLPIDYNIYAILLVLVFYFFEKRKCIYTFGMVFIALSYYFFKNNMTQSFMLLSLPFLYLYNGQKGKNLKYLFYVFYPLHMLILAFIKIYFKI